ncbi:MAG: hypothetical protein EHM65_10230, partial [Acidobacteriales bacterium]
MHLPKFPAAAVVLAALCGFALDPARGQTEKRLSAREIFYAAQAEPPAVKRASPPQAAPARKKAVESANTKPPAQPPARVASPARLPEGGELVPASYTSTESNPLGVRYTILKREGADSVEVAPDAVFRSGDRIRLRVEVN